MDDQQTAELSAEGSVLTAGERLLQAREARALELRDVAEQTKQSQDTLLALETMKTAHIPASILRLQAKNYARFLGLPENEIAAAFADAPGSIDTEAMPTETRRAGYSTKTMAIAAGAVFAAICAIGGISLLLQPKPSTDADPLAISARLAPAFAGTTDIQAFASAATDEFSIQANRRAWIEVRGSDGTVFRNREMQAGETYFPRTGAGWTITVKDAGAFSWYLGDAVYDAIGDDQQALYSVSIDNVMSDALAARSAALAEVKNAADQPR